MMRCVLTRRDWSLLVALAVGILTSAACHGEPQTFTVAVPEGNYRVTVKLGDATQATATTVESENRRLMLEDVRTAPGEYVTRTFLVNVHTPRINADRSVRLKDREVGILRWDDKLNLRFTGSHPAVRDVDVAPATDVITIYLAGDSTVTDQTEEPWAGWGQMLPRFFKPDRVVVSNHAESGETLASFEGERRLEKVLTTLGKGDYLFIQFGHNDMKQKGPDAGAFKNYTRLLKKFIAAARERGATPVLVTPMNRLPISRDGKPVPTLGDYPDAMRRVAKEEQVTLIDLNRRSGEIYDSLGLERTRAAFVDDTHSNEIGAFDFARFVAEQIQQSDLPIATEVIDEIPPAKMH
jgi:lysophospholipase L1-like esterase